METLELPKNQTLKQKQNNILKKRINYFDIAKGLGILLMIIGHMPIKNEYLKNFIFCFHMPLFFIISGYFFKHKDNKECLKNIFKKLIKPYIITCLAIIFYQVLKLFLNKNFIEIPNTLKTWGLASLYGSGSMQPFGIKYIGAIWFLLALASATYIINNIYTSKYRNLLVILISYIGYKTSKYIWFPFSIQAGMVATIFMYVGIIIKEKDILHKKLSVTTYIFIISITIFCIIYGGKLYMVSNIYKNGLLDIIGAISTSFLFIKLCMQIDTHSKHLKKPFIYIGKNSLICLCLHLFSLDCLHYSTLNKILTKIGLSNYTLNSITLNILWVLFMLLFIKLTLKAFDSIKRTLK